jgi:hypothetical protein
MAKSLTESGGEHRKSWMAIEGRAVLVTTHL